MMKTLISAIVLTAAAGVAQADIKLETRGYHSNLRVDADTAYLYLNGVPAGHTGVSEGFFNTAGGGVAAVFHADEVAEFGVGFNLARYYPTPDTDLTEQEINAFSRWNVLQPGATKLYVLAGVSSHELNGGTRDSSANDSSKISFTPVVNYDFGVGSSYKIGPVDLGLEYKYSNTLATGAATASSKGVDYDGENFSPLEMRSKFQDVRMESQEMALTVGMKL